MDKKISRFQKYMISLFAFTLLIFLFKSNVYALEDVDNYTPQYKKYNYFGI